MPAAAWAETASGRTAAVSSEAGSIKAVKKKQTLKLTKKNKVKILTVKAGTVITLKVKYGKKLVDASKLKFTSSKKKVATVSSNGVISTLKSGTVKIRVRRRYKKLYVTLKLKVLPPDPEMTVSADEESVSAAEMTSGMAIRSGTAVSAATAQTSACAPTHTHKWKTLSVSSYPAKYCATCGLLQWTGSDSLKEEAELSTKRHFVMIGDSYAARSSSWGGQYTWPYQLCKKMGLGEGQACISAKGGYGFAAKLTSGTAYFVDLLRLVDPDPNVTDIIIVGGIANDQYRTKAEIQEGFAKITLEAHVRFPKARIIYAAPNCHISNTTWQNTLDTRRPWYKSFCALYGWIYLDGCETVLPREAAYFQADGHHPNAAGEEILGAGLLEKLKKVL